MRGDIWSRIINDEKPGRKIINLTTLACLPRIIRSYQNLSKVVSDAHVEDFITGQERIWKLSLNMPRIDWIYWLYAGLGTSVDPKRKRERSGRGNGANGGYIWKGKLFCRITQSWIEEQAQLVPVLLKLAKQFDLKVIASNDVHYVQEEDWAHDALLCIQTGAKIDDQNRMRYDARQFYLKSREQMEELFKEAPEAITNTCGRGNV